MAHSVKPPCDSRGGLRPSILRSGRTQDAPTTPWGLLRSRRPGWAAPSRSGPRDAAWQGRTNALDPSDRLEYVTRQGQAPARSIRPLWAVGSSPNSASASRGAPSPERARTPSLGDSDGRSTSVARARRPQRERRAASPDAAPAASPPAPRNAPFPVTWLQGHTPLSVDGPLSRPYERPRFPRPPRGGGRETRV